MSVFTKHLKEESELIRAGLDLFRAFYDDLQSGKTLLAEDLRVALYAMQVALERSHLTKEETLLYPALQSSELNKASYLEIEQVLKLSELEHEKNRTQLLELRLSVDDQEAHPSANAIFGLHLAEFVAQISSFLESEEKQLLCLADQMLDAKAQKGLLERALKFEQTQGLEQLRSSRMIFNHLRTKRGMPAA